MSLDCGNLFPFTVYPPLNRQRKPVKLHPDTEISGSSALLPAGTAIRADRNPAGYVFVAATGIRKTKAAFYLDERNDKERAGDADGRD